MPAALAGAMEVLIALIALAAGLTLERTRPSAEVVRVRSRND